MKIRIDSMRIRAAHGALPLERTVGQDFEVSLVLDVDYDGSDSLEATVNYAEVCAVVTAQMRQPSALVEHAAMRVAKALQAAFPRIARGSVTVAKLAPPMPFEVAQVAVTVDFPLC